jgi:hypothetical protein
MVDKKLVEAFHLMWDNFPEPVRLIHKDRTILVLNKAGEKVGWQTGTKCSSIPPLEAHKICKANEAIKNHVYTYAETEGNLGGESVYFWIPVDGYNDYFIHFAIGRRVKYE